MPVGFHQTGERLEVGDWGRKVIEQVKLDDDVDASPFDGLGGRSRHIQTPANGFIFPGEPRLQRCELQPAKTISGGPSKPAIPTANLEDRRGQDVTAAECAPEGMKFGGGAAGPDFGAGATNRAVVVLGELGARGPSPDPGTVAVLHAVAGGIEKHTSAR